MPPRRSAPTPYLTESQPTALRSISRGNGGLMALPLSQPRRELLLWFRTETIHTIRWAGNPSDKPTIAGWRGPRLTPRRSFELFRESVQSRSLPWLDVEQESAAQLRTLLREAALIAAEPLAITEREMLKQRTDRLPDAPPK